MGDYKSINNNSAYLIVREAYEQMAGQEAVDTIDLQDFIDTGNEGSSLITNKEQFLQALVNVCVKNVYENNDKYLGQKDPFYVDSMEYGAIIQSISAEVPEVKESSAWHTFVSGTTQVGTYTVYLPVVNAQYFGKTVDYALPLTWSEEQLNDAFNNAEELGAFAAYVQVCVANALAMHEENQQRLAVANFIAEKYAYSQAVGSTGVHFINLVELYQEECGSTIETAEDFLKNADAMRWASGKISLYKDYMQGASVLFNTAGRVRFTPKDRVVCMVLSHFAKAVDTFALSDTFNQEIVSLPNYVPVPFWQGIGTADFESVSTVDVETASAGSEVTISGIVAFLCDQRAIMHTMRGKRVAMQNFPIEHLTHTEYQSRDLRANNLTLNGIVFAVQDAEITA